MLAVSMLTSVQLSHVILTADQDMIGLFDGVLCWRHLVVLALGALSSQYYAQMILRSKIVFPFTRPVEDAGDARKR